VPEAVISDVRVAAAHDGVAELVVTLRHGNGGISEVNLDQLAAAALFRACHASTTEELMGHGWEKVREALGVSWNRFADKHIGG
jgi:hypothetical protein